MASPNGGNDGRVPRTVEVELHGDLVDSCVAGDVVTVLAIVKVPPPPDFAAQSLSQTKGHLWVGKRIKPGMVQLRGNRSGLLHLERYQGHHQAVAVTDQDLRVHCYPFRCPAAGCKNSTWEQRHNCSTLRIVGRWRMAGLAFNGSVPGRGAVGSTRVSTACARLLVSRARGGAGSFPVHRQGKASRE